MGGEKGMSWNKSIILLVVEELVMMGLKLMIFLFVFLFRSVFFGVIGRRNLKNRVNHEIKIFFFVSDIGVEFLIDYMENTWINDVDDIEMFFGPTLKDFFEIGASLGGFLQSFLCVRIEVIFDGIG